MPIIKVFFAWYDFWIGVYYDRYYQNIYICPLPMICIKVSIKKLQVRALNKWADEVGRDRT